MKSYVVDANVIFSGLISGKERYQQIFSDHHFLLPDFALVEIQKYQELILEKTKLEPEKLRSFTLQLFSNLIVIPNFLISNRSFLHAYNLCKDIDEKDTPYLALSIEFDLEFISKDEELVNGLRKKNFEKVISLNEFFETLGQDRGSEK